MKTELVKNGKYTITQDGKHFDLYAHGQFVRSFSTLVDAEAYAAQGLIDTAKIEQDCGFSRGAA